ncbi:unnamed protein product [Symbiodinium necroappetens]|uniref:Uncharacterized protein n=1 Tax=Symbiodinium necroappetens TaxID=1628268 RepID=A0A812XYM6_9DINO|nr:unnamed protein product [Symbiodinium necroappetens]
MASMPMVYLVVLKVLGIYDPKNPIVHLPLNVLWFSSIALNAIAFSAKAGASRREAVAMSFAFIFALVPPVATANAIFMLVFPRYVSSDCSFLHKGFVVGVVVPSSFFFSQFCSRQACLVIMGPNRHPGRVARLLCFSMILESFARRILLCGVQDLRLIILSSLVLGVGDSVAQISVDLRDGIVYSCITCGASDYKLFEHPGRRRLRADALLLHYMSEHLAIVCLSGFAVLVQVINLDLPVGWVLWSLVSLVLQMAVRLIFDLIVFSTEGQVGCIARALFRLTRWHGIPVIEVWRKCRRELLFFSMHMALTAAMYGQYFFKTFFEKSLAPEELGSHSSKMLAWM